MSSTVRIDPDGWIRFVLSSKRYAKNLAIRYWDPTRTPGVVGSLEGKAVFGTESELPALRLEGEIPIARGICVDDRGRPLAGCRLQLQRRRVEEGRTSTRDVPKLSARSGKDGRFTIAVPVRLEGLEIYASKIEHVDRVVPCRPEHEHRIVLQRLSSLELRFEGLPSAVHELRVEHFVGKRRIPYQNVEHVKIREGRGRVRFPRVRPGIVTCGFQAKGIAGAWFQDVKVAPGAAERVDIAPPVHRHVELEVASIDGVSVSIPKHRLSFIAKFGERKITIPSLAEELEIELHKPGFELMRRTCSAGRHAVSFQRAPETVIEVQGVETTILRRLQLVAKTRRRRRARSASGWEATQLGARSLFDENGKTKLRLPSPFDAYSIHLGRAGFADQVEILRVDAKTRRARYIVIPKPAQRAKLQELALRAK